MITPLLQCISEEPEEIFFYNANGVTIPMEEYMRRCNSYDEFEARYLHQFNPDLLWYGLDQSKPIDKWSVKYGEPVSDGWFLYDTWSLAEYLLDDTNDCFLIWFTAECGCCLPEMGEILKECPIHFSEGDSIAEIKHKMDEFFHCRVTPDALTADERV